VKKVKVMDGFGCSTRGGIPSGMNGNETSERWFISSESERKTDRRRRRPWTSRGHEWGAP
jgi:hypothetical protein